MKQKLFVVVATLIVLQVSTSIIAQQLNAPQRSYQQARRVLDDAIEAHGGLEALRAIKDFTLKEKGKLMHAFKAQAQNHRSLREPLKKLSSSILIVDLSSMT
jgi:hypothetical protein